MTKPTPYVYPVGGTPKTARNHNEGNLISSNTMQDWYAHPGIGFEAKIGDPVKVTDSGKVRDPYVDDNLGDVVTIEHNDGIVAYYCGLSDVFLVRKGDEVDAGRKIGSVNVISIESVEKSHLHLEVKKSGELIDPITLFEQVKSYKETHKTDKSPPTIVGGDLYKISSKNFAGQKPLPF